MEIRIGMYPTLKPMIDASVLICRSQISLPVRPSHSSSGRTHHRRRRHQGPDVGESCSRTCLVVSDSYCRAAGPKRSEGGIRKTKAKLAIGFEHADYSTAESGAGREQDDHMTS